MIYSPSQTRMWKQCPIKRMLVQDGWQTRMVARRDLAACFGSAFADGVALINLYGPDSDWAGAARQRVQHTLDEWNTLGRQVAYHDQGTAETIEERVIKCLTKYVKEDRLPASWKVLDVERTIPEAGNCRIDLGIDDGRGPAVLDYKCKMYLKKEGEDRVVAQYAHDWSMYHYCWAYGEFVHRTDISRYYIALVVAEPSFRFTIYPYTIHPETFKVWRDTAQRDWQTMTIEAEGHRAPGLPANHADEFGPCEFYRACFEQHWDSSLMIRDYVMRKER